MRSIPFLFILLGLLPQAAQACSVCFGAGGGEWARGFYWGILLLLTLPLMLFLGIGGMIVLSTRKKNRDALQSHPKPLSPH